MTASIFLKPTVTHPLIAGWLRCGLLSRRSSKHVREGISQLQEIVEGVGLLLWSRALISGSKEIDDVARWCGRRWKEGIVGICRRSNFRLLSGGKKKSLKKVRTRTATVKKPCIDSSPLPLRPRLAPLNPHQCHCCATRTSLTKRLCRTMS